MMKQPVADGEGRLSEDEQEPEAEEPGGVVGLAGHQDLDARVLAAAPDRQRHRAWGG